MGGLLCEKELGTSKPMSALIRVSSLWVNQHSEARATALHTC